MTHYDFIKNATIEEIAEVLYEYYQIGKVEECQKMKREMEQNRWIPCSEKLPSDSCWDWRGLDAPCPKVEITTVDRERYIGYFMGGCWYDINGNCIDVVAWKKPSEPWEEECDE